MRTSNLITDVHCLHVWAITKGVNAMTCVITVQSEMKEGVKEPICQQSLLNDVKENVSKHFDITHTCIELDQPVIFFTVTNKRWKVRSETKNIYKLFHLTKRIGRCLNSPKLEAQRTWGDLIWLIIQNLTIWLCRTFFSESLCWSKSAS